MLDKGIRADLIEGASEMFGMEAIHGPQGEAALRAVPVPRVVAASYEPRPIDPIAYALRAGGPYRAGPSRRILSSPRRRLGPGHDRDTFLAGLCRSGPGPARQEACP